MNIRPVSDLRNKYNEVELELKESGAVYLTKNGYGTAVLVDVDEYSRLTGTRKIENPERGKCGKSDRGYLNRYSNPELMSMEKNAGRLHALRKFEQEV